MKKNDGFTLLEVVISLAALSFISVFILQMFLASASLNERAKNSDIALAKAISEIESLKKCDSLSEYVESAEGAEHTQEAEGKTVLSLYYDEYWNIMETSGGTGAKFCLRMNISPDGGLWVVSANVEEITALEGRRLLAELATKKYFPKNAAAVL